MKFAIAVLIVFAVAVLSLVHWVAPNYQPMEARQILAAPEGFA